MADSGHEQRRFERKELNTALKYAILYPSYKEGLTVNISQGGLCILISDRMNKGDILRVEFYLPGEEKNVIEAVGRIVWQEQQADGYLTGVEFLT